MTSKGQVVFAVLILCFALAPIRTSAQESAPKKTEAHATELKANDATASKPGQFSDQELDLRFNYPVEMRPLDLTAEMESGHMNVFGTSAENDPEHQKAKRCVRGLLDVDLPQDKAPQRLANMDGVWVDDTKEYRESRKPQPIFAKILLTELDKACLPKKLQKNENDALGNIALSVVSIPGIQRMPKPLRYEIGKQTIHMNSGCGRPVVNGKVYAAPLLVMSMATQWRGHLLAWVFTSNDTEIFNELTKSLVQFGNGPWGQMFPANVTPGGFKGMNLLPK